MNDMERDLVFNNVYSSLENSNFNVDYKNIIAEILINLKEIHPNVDLNQVYKGLELNSGINFKPEEFKPWWGGFYRNAGIDRNGNIEKGYICFRDVSEVDFDDFNFSETFIHEMLHSFSQEQKFSNSHYYFKSGLGATLGNVNELFTDYCAMEIANKVGYERECDNLLTFKSYDDLIKVSNDTPGYTYFTFYGKFLDYMYGDEIISDMFNHTSFLDSEELNPLFVSFNAAIDNLKEDQSFDNYVKVDKALSLIASNYLKDNITNMSISDYIEFRQLYEHSLPIINDKSLNENQLEDFDKLYYMNNFNKNIESKSFEDFKLKLLFVKEFDENEFDFNSISVDEKFSEDGLKEYYVKSNQNDNIFYFKLDNEGRIDESVALLDVPDNLNFKKLSTHNKSLLSNLRRDIYFEKDKEESFNFDTILNKSSLSILENFNSKDVDSFQKKTIDFAYNKSFIISNNFGDFKDLLYDNSFKDEEGRNASYLLLKGINSDRKVRDFIQVLDVSPFLEKDNNGKDFFDYSLENKKDVFVSAVLLNSNTLFSTCNISDILKQHKDSIYNNPEVFFESIKNISTIKSYGKDDLTELIKTIDEAVDLKNLKDKEGNNIINYLEKDNYNLNNCFREDSLDNFSYKENLRTALVLNNISFTDENILGETAFDRYSKNFNGNINELKSILKNTDVLDKNVLPEKILYSIDGSLLDELSDSGFDFNSLKGDYICNKLFNSAYVSNDTKLSILLYNDSIGDSESGKEFFYKLMNDAANYNDKEFIGLASVFERISEKGFNLNELTLEGQSIGEFLISQNRFGDIRTLIRDSKLDLFDFSNGDCLYNKLIEAENNKDISKIFIEDNFVQKLLSDLDDSNMNYLQRILVNKDISLENKLMNIEYLEKSGINFNNKENSELNITFYIQNDESIAILDSLMDKGFDIFHKTETDLCYAELMVYRNMSQTMKFCAEKDPSFIDGLFDKSCTYEEKLTLFDRMVDKKDFDSIAYIISGNEKMIDNIINSENSQKLDVLKEICERYPNFLDKVTRSDAFNNLDDLDKIDVFVNRGSIDRFFSEKNFEGLSSFMDFKPSCVSYIKEHPEFEDAPIDFKEKALSLDEEKTIDIDLVKNHTSEVFEL